MTAVAADMTGARPARWLMPVLVGSLALNLIVIGAIGSLLWRSHSETAGGKLSRRVVPNVVGYAVTLPPDRVSELERVTREEWQRVRPLRRALVEARAEAVQALTADQFDRDRYLAAQARVAAADQASREAAFKLHTAISLNLTPEERRGFLRWREQQLQRRPQNPLDVPEDVPAREPQR
jgi:uncharacterized membrane protein